MATYAQGDPGDKVTIWINIGFTLERSCFIHRSFLLFAAKMDK